MKSYQFLLHLAAIIICFSASAPAAAPKKAVASAFTLTPYVESEYIYFTATAGDQMGKTQRNPSKSKLSESMMSQEAKTLRDDFLKIQNSTELAKLVDRCENEKEYDSLKNADAKYLAAVLASLKPLRGALYRFRPLFSSEKVTHSIVLTFVKNISINIQMISAKNPIEFVFDYLAAPYAENGKMIDQIPSEGQFQEWLDQVAKKNLIKLITKTYNKYFIN